VALVQSRASLLGGDDVRLRIELEAGALLELVELGATIAHHARAGPPARLAAVVRLGPGARLVWLGEPLIAAAGCSVRRSTSVELAAGAAVLLREGLVLGRAGEEPGRVRAHTRIVHGGLPLVDETLDTDPLWLMRSSVVAGAAGMIDALTLAGLRDPEPPAGVLDAHGPASLWRRVGPARDGVDGPIPRWRSLVLAGAPAPSAGGDLRPVGAERRSGHDEGDAERLERAR
jgi:hypothetical protein